MVEIHGDNEIPFVGGKPLEHSLHKSVIVVRGPKIPYTLPELRECHKNELKAAFMAGEEARRLSPLTREHDFAIWYISVYGEPDPVREAQDNALDINGPELGFNPDTVAGL